MSLLSFSGDDEFRSGVADDVGGTPELSLMRMKALRASSLHVPVPPSDPLLKPLLDPLLGLSDDALLDGLLVVVVVVVFVVVDVQVVS